MARNGSDGTYTLADTVAPATLADANEVMIILDDIESEITNSIAKDGQTAITGQLKGLVSANPAYSFNADLNTGLGSDAADEVFIKCGGTKIAKLSSAGLDVLSGALLIAGGPALATGLVMAYVGASAPAGWILAHGGSIGDGSSSATVRANADAFPLFEIIWNTSNQSGGEGQIQDSSGANTTRGASAAADFAAHKRILIADMSDRVPRGKGGATAHGQALGADSVAVAQANLPNVSFVHSGTTLADGGHSHGYNDPTHKHVASYRSTASGTFTGPGGNGWGGDTTADTLGASIGITINSASSNISVSNQGSAASGGSGTALDIKGKAIVKSFIVKL